jgi:hypothetical protein
MPFHPRPALVRAIQLIALLAAAVPSQALLNIDGTKNQVFVFGGVTFTQSSNIFSERDGRGDYSVTAEIGADLKRRAGIISVNSTAKLDYIRYGEFTEENTLNPSFVIELIKSTGRTTGSFSLSAYRETRSDSAVNLRTSSWNMPVVLNLRYPISEKTYVTSTTGYLRRSYSDNQALVDYTDYSEAVDFYYVYTSKLDLFAGYRFRSGDTSVTGRSLDHWFSVGATGGLFSKMSGTVRFGYQVRNVRGAGGDQFNHFNAMAAVNWPVTRKLVLSLQASRDFNTIATGATVDSTSLALRALYAYNSKLDVSAMVSTGRNDFLNAIETSRRDTFFSWETGVRYRMNAHLQMGASYVYLKNWSTLALADFDSHGFSLDVTSRY